MSKLTVDECKRIIMQGRKQLTAAEQRIAELEGEQGSRWFELFGTPERAADYFAEKCFDDGYCPHCPMFYDCDEQLHVGGTFPTVRAALLEWLKGANE